MKKNYLVTFETQCYEKDWEFLLKTNYLDQMIKNCNYEFACKQLIINNVKNKRLVRHYAQKKVDSGIIDKFYFVDDYIDKVLDFFHISKKNLGSGYYYLASALVGVYLTKTKFLLHFTTDAFIPPFKKTSLSVWIPKACQMLKENPKYLTANPVWNYARADALKEAQGKIDNNFYIGFGFSDQCFLIRTKDFMCDIYNYRHPASARYPKYGYGGFEHRVDSYMQTKKYYRLTYSKENYIHFNFPRTYFFRQLCFLSLKLNIYFLIKPLEAQIITILRKNLSPIKYWIITKIKKKT